MSQKKRSNKPIRITLTEGQIADIIQSAAKTHRSLGAQSLEDRIAPSTIGAPIFDPGLGGDEPPLPYDPANPPPPDAQYPSDPNSFDPNLPPQPPMPGVDGQYPSGTPPLDPNLPDQPNLDPTSQYPSGPIDPPVPPFDPSTDPYTHHQAVLNGDMPQPPALEPNIDPVSGEPILPGDTNPVGGDGVGMPGPQSPDGGVMPTQDELEEHRKNMLRQLRGM